MAQKRVKTRFPGVYARTTTDPRRKHNGRPDRAFDFCFKDPEGKLCWETAGWLSEGVSEQFAAHLRAERIDAIKNTRRSPAISESRHEAAPTLLFSAIAETYLLWLEGESKYKDNLDELERVVAPRYYRKLVAFLDDAERKARKFIGKQSKSQAVQNKLAHCDYEEFYHLMLDAMIYGAAEETAFAEALKNAPKRSDKGSSKECLTTNEGAIENFAESSVDAQDSLYKMDFEKLRRSFGELLSRERIATMKPRKDCPPSDGEKMAQALAAEDMASWTVSLRGLRMRRFSPGLA